jgi:Holliday junction resolvase
MSHRFSKPSKDANHDEIRDTLKAHGYSVGDMASVGKSFPDLIGSDEKTTVIFEAKTEAGLFYIAQLEFLALWRGWSAFVSTGDEAIRAMKEPEKYCLSKREKEVILQIVHKFRAFSTAKHPQIRVKQFERNLAEILKT